MGCVCCNKFYRFVKIYDRRLCELLFNVEVVEVEVDNLLVFDVGEKIVVIWFICGDFLGCLYVYY